MVHFVKFVWRIKLVIAKAGIKYKEIGFVIYPIPRITPNDIVTYPYENYINVPVGSQISGAKSQNDWAKFGTPDDIIRIYTLVPDIKEVETIQHTIYVVPTGMQVEFSMDVKKLTIVKEKDGGNIFHIYTNYFES